jgi:hypothetical protein
VHVADSAFTLVCVFLSGTPAYYASSSLVVAQSLSGLEAVSLAALHVLYVLSLPHAPSKWPSVHVPPVLTQSSVMCDSHWLVCDLQLLGYDPHAALAGQRGH